MITFTEEERKIANKVDAAYHQEDLVNMLEEIANSPEFSDQKRHIEKIIEKVKAIDTYEDFLVLNDILMDEYGPYYDPDTMYIRVKFMILQEYFGLKF